MRQTRQDARYTTNAERQAAYRTRHTGKEKLQGMINALVVEVDNHPRIEPEDKRAIQTKIRELQGQIAATKLLTID